MNKTASIYFDLIRFLSAILVFAYHASFNRFDGAWLKSIGAFGHDAVMVFFVLSGFVIAYITSTKETTLSHYTKNRLARLYSVALPALILTVILDYFGRIIDPSMYVGNHYQDSNPIYRFFANLFFVNEIWFTSWRAFSNGPFWSLCYEFWYYVIFASWFYLSSYKKWVFITIAMLISGPKVLLLFPVWIMGAIVFHLSSRLKLGKVSAILLAVFPLLLYILIREYDVQKYLLSETVALLGKDFVYNELNLSGGFVSDYLVGVLVSMNFIGMMALSKNFSFPDYAGRLIRYLAAMTFTFYLFHYPLLQFFGSFIYSGVGIVTLTSLSIMLIAPFTEGKKRNWVAFIEQFSVLLKNRRIGNFTRWRS
jgi:peptidoglycan/LPS O-acetylase OafA/YrhL